jgi:hypothetical protein
MRSEAFQWMHMMIKTVTEEGGPQRRARCRAGSDAIVDHNDDTGVRNGFRRPDGRGSGQFAESALDTLYVARNRG